MADKTYRLRYLPLFYEDLEQKVTYENILIIASMSKTLLFTMW